MLLQVVNARSERSTGSCGKNPHTSLKLRESSSRITHRLNTRCTESQKENEIAQFDKKTTEVRGDDVRKKFNDLAWRS